MFRLVFTNLRRRPWRSGLTISGIGIAVAVLLLIDELGKAYRGQLLRELNSMGLHLMLVPLGCPYDAAARVLKGSTLETSLPEAAVSTVRADPDVECAAPLLIAAVPRAREKRTDLFVGLDESGIALKTWWKAARGHAIFSGADSMILGAEAAQAEMREPGDLFYSPELRREFRVVAVLERSGTSDDSLFFIPLRTAQTMLNSSNRITAVAVRLRDPVRLGPVSARLADIPGAQVVTQTEMMGTFLNLLGTIRTLLQSIGWVALAASGAGLLNTLFMSVAERRLEFSLFRALGASRLQLFHVVAFESIVLTGMGVFGGVAFSGAAQVCVARFVGLDLALMAERQPLLWSVVRASALGLGGAILASAFPAWRAMQVEPATVLKGVE